MRHYFCVLFLILVLGANAEAAQRKHWGDKPWPHIDNVVLTSSVTLNAGHFIYDYTLHNAKTNTLPLFRFQIDLRLNSLEHPLSSQDVTAGHDAGDHIKLLHQAAKLRPEKMSSPPGWGIDYPGLWGVDGLIVSNMVHPGQSLAGFKVISSAPPDIREFAVDAYSWNFIDSPEGYQFYGTHDELFDEANKGIQYLGKTIAPVLPPEPLTAGTWAAHIQSLAIEARKLGWVSADEPLKRIQDLAGGLDTDKKRRLKTAVRKIEVYVLAEKKAGRLTEEADALVRLNALYLLRRARKDSSVLRR